MSNQQHSTLIEYRDISGFPGYRVGNDGSVWSRVVQKSFGHQRGWITVLGEFWRKLRPVTTQSGHHVVTLCDGTGKHSRIHVHVLVLQAFVGPRPEGMLGRHFPDRDPTNNRLENLSWGTHKQNCQDKIVHGTSGKQTPPGSAKLNPAKVIEIRKVASQGHYTFTELGRRFGVGRKAISRLLCGESWSWV